MSLEQFKFIWTMEYLHRMWGRAVGIVFLIPCAYFWKRGYFTRALKTRMIAAGLLIVAQVNRLFQSAAWAPFPLAHCQPLTHPVLHPY